MQPHILIWASIFIAICQNCVLAASRKRGRLLSVFNVVRFQNDVCETAESNFQGTCYTESECREAGGRASGVCAEGFGVCCLGPSTRTVPVGNLLNGRLTEDTVSSPAVSDAGLCTDEFMSVTSPGGIAPPMICGQNTGQHLYVDASSSCNDINIFRSSASSSSAWLVKVTQVSCQSLLLAPPGCTQFYFGPAAGTVQSFNYDGGRHLANQEQQICVRGEKDTCGVCWAAVLGADFGLSGPGNMGITSDQICCGYGSVGVDTRGYDCLIIPEASSNMGQMIKANRFCGGGKGLAQVGSRTAMDPFPIVPGRILDSTICSRRQPYQISFVSDTFEFLAEAGASTQKGFRLSYQLQACPMA